MEGAADERSALVRMRMFRLLPGGRWTEIMGMFEMKEGLRSLRRKFHREWIPRLLTPACTDDDPTPVMLVAVR